MKNDNVDICLRGGWPIHLANLDILYGIIDDLVDTSSDIFHYTKPKCLMCWLEERYYSNQLYWYDIVNMGKYVDVHLTIRYIDDNPANTILDEIHLTCQRNDI